ncbi:MAG: 5-formyltetrahydrofolate cyclo-ligase, partial [Oscillospiraceae bacterium]|nr:5-formyltetrahydrofolate cyclo-ligase [Oscillospiraceae bacterium]
RVALPRCGKRGEMTFYLVKGKQDLTAGKYGIPEPAAHCAAAAATECSLCIVPGLAFDLCGYRIGYGGGYYDRFLQSFPGQSVGLVRQSFLCKTLPKEPFDQAVDAVVTQNGWLEI